MIAGPTRLDGRRIGRGGYASGLAIACCALAVSAWLAEASLPAMARVLGPRGINAGLALNVILVALGLGFLCAVGTLTARRLRDAGRPAALAMVPIASLVAWAIASDAVFLWSHRLGLAASAAHALALAALAAAGAGLAAALALSSRGARPPG